MCFAIRKGLNSLLSYISEMGKVVVVVPLWKRILAYLIDSILLTFLVLTPLIKPFSFSIESGSNFFQSFASYSTSFSTEDLWLAFMIAFFYLAYFCLLEFWFGQTVGKVIVGIKVESTKKKPLNLLQTIIRNISKLSTLLLILDTIYLLIKKDNQRYLEVLSNTHVIMDGEIHA